MGSHLPAGVTSPTGIVDCSSMSDHASLTYLAITLKNLRDKRTTQVNPIFIHASKNVSRQMYGKQRDHNVMTLCPSEEPRVTLDAPEPDGTSERRPSAVMLELSNGLNPRERLRLSSSPWDPRSKVHNEQLLPKRLPKRRGRPRKFTRKKGERRLRDSKKPTATYEPHPAQKHLERWTPYELSLG